MKYSKCTWVWLRNRVLFSSKARRRPSYLQLLGLNVRFCPRAAVVSPVCKIGQSYSWKTPLAIPDASTKSQTMLTRTELLSWLISRHQNVLTILFSITQPCQDISQTHPTCQVTWSPFLYAGQARWGHRTRVDEETPLRVRLRKEKLFASGLLRRNSEL